MAMHKNPVKLVVFTTGSKGRVSVIPVDLVVYGRANGG